MTSLLQFSGEIRGRKVGLEFTLPTPWDPVGKTFVPSDGYDCQVCGRRHARIYVAFRRPVGMIGCWVQFRINGRVHAPDLSIPIGVDPESAHGVRVLPRDARPLTDEESSRRWHAT
jgi:hypothetical protein